MIFPGVALLIFKQGHLLLIPTLISASDFIRLLNIVGTPFQFSIHRLLSSFHQVLLLLYIFPIFQMNQFVKFHGYIKSTNPLFWDLFVETAAPENPRNFAHRNLKWVREACQLTLASVGYKVYICHQAKNQFKKLLYFSLWPCSSALWFFLYNL